MLYQYLLQIDEYPCFRGVGGFHIKKKFETIDQAKEFLNNFDRKFFHANLQTVFGTPCNFDGRLCDENNWEQISGGNGEHPDYIRYKKDFMSIVREVRKIYADEHKNKRPHRGTVAIAHEVLERRYPGLNPGGWCESVGKYAAKVADYEDYYPC